MRSGLLALCLLGSLSAQAQSPVWALRGAHNTVYLAESVHLLKPDAATLPRSFERAYASAHTIVMEIDLSRVGPEQLSEYMLAHGALQSDTSLQQLLGASDYARLAGQSDALGLPLEALQHVAPWVVALSLAELEYVKLGYDPEQGVERQIERRAEHDGKPIQGLETVEQQLGQLAQLTPEQQRRFLLLTLEDLHEADHDTDALLTAWRAGDTRRLASLLGEEYRSFPELYRALVSERNRRWMPQIERMLEQREDYMVLVGALHLVGDGGLLELARAAGLAVTPVN